MAIVFGIDHGNGNIKTKHFVFPCGLVKQSVAPAKVFEQDVIKYKDKYYMLSETRMPYKSDKSKDMDYFILTLFAIAKEAKKRDINIYGKEIVLSIGLPPADFSAYADSFTKYFKDNAKNGITFSYNDVAISCYLKAVYIAPQNFAAVMTYESKLIKEYNTVYCIDIGDGTVDLLVLKNGMPDLKTRVSNKSGIAVMRSEIANAVQQNFGYQLDGDVIEQILRDKKTVLPQEIIEFVKAQAETWFTKIVNELHPYVPDFRINLTVFLGGGSLILKKYIEASEEFGLKEFIEDIKANAIGYQIIAEKKEENSK